MSKVVYIVQFFILGFSFFYNIYIVQKNSLDPFSNIKCQKNEICAGGHLPN